MGKVCRRIDSRRARAPAAAAAASAASRALARGRAACEPRQGRTGSRGGVILLATRAAESSWTKIKYPDGVNHPFLLSPLFAQRAIIAAGIARVRSRIHVCERCFAICAKRRKEELEGRAFFSRSAELKDVREKPVGLDHKLFAASHWPV